MLMLKLGGAAITDKTRANTPNLPAIHQIATQIAHHQSQQKEPLVLIHGAGSYGHVIAQEHQLHLGYQQPRQRGAVVELQRQLHALNTLIIDALQSAGVLAMPIHPASMAVLEAGRIADMLLEPVQRTLEMNMVPVLYGDCLWDRAQGFSILSGDQLMVYLGNALGASRLAFGTNVDGVLDANDQVLREIAADAPLADHHGATRADVTGGMLGKLQEIAKSHAPVHIFNLNKPEQLTRILAGATAGTRIVTKKK